MFRRALLKRVTYAVNGRLDGLVRRERMKPRLIHQWPWVLVLAAAALAQPSPAAAAGTWTSQDLTHVSVSWRVDDGKGAFSTAFKLTQPVMAAQTSEGGPARRTSIRIRPRSSVQAA